MVPLFAFSFLLSFIHSVEITEYKYDCYACLLEGYHYCFYWSSCHTDYGDWCGVGASGLDEIFNCGNPFAKRTCDAIKISEK